METRSYFWLTAWERCRFLIESDAFSGRSFRSKVRTFISLNGPQLGAPVMLARALGLQKTDHIAEADGPRILATAPFSAGYDLLPKPGYDCLFNETQPFDPYDPAHEPYLRFGLSNLAEAQDFWASSGFGRRAEDVEYVIVRSFLDTDGGGASTIAAVRSDGRQWRIESGPGDGSVQKSSAEGLGAANVVLPGEHLGVIETDRFRMDVFERYIGKITAEEYLAMRVRPSLKLQPLGRDMPTAAVARFALVHDHGQAPFPITGTLNWVRLSRNGAVRNGPIALREEVALPAEDAPTLQVTAPAEPGLYRVILKIHGEAVTLMSPQTSVLVTGRGEALPPPNPPGPP